MALRFQYNKTALQELKKQLLVRQRALPILKNKETALRQEIKKLSHHLDLLIREFEAAMKAGERFAIYWNVFPPILSVREIRYNQRNIVGIRVPEVSEVIFNESDVSWIVHAAWIPAGVHRLRELLELKIKKETTEHQLELLHQARKKTTQKVNLYEKVQIPELEAGLIRIKRFLEDKENIAKAAQF